MDAYPARFRTVASLDEALDMAVRYVRAWRGRHFGLRSQVVAL